MTTITLTDEQGAALDAAVANEAKRRNVPVTTGDVLGRLIRDYVGGDELQKLNAAVAELRVPTDAARASLATLFSSVKVS